MLRGDERVSARLRAVLLAAALSNLGGAAMAQGKLPSYEIVSRDPAALEIRFHNMPMREVHADDAQNALLLNFDKAVDGAVFDRLAADAPDWIGMAYGSYDAGVIRATRPATFLTRREQDGFSLRILARGSIPAPPKPVALRGPLDEQPQPLGAPPIQAHADSGAPFDAPRNHFALELALMRDDPALNQAYDGAGNMADSDLRLGSDWRQYHGGDTVIASVAMARVAIGEGLSLIGHLEDTNLRGKSIRFLDGHTGMNQTNILSGSGGFALDLWDGQQIRGEALAGNGVLGGTLASFSGGANGYWNAALTYHRPDLDTPEAAADKADRDEIIVSAQDRLGYGLWGGLAGFAHRYGVTSSDRVADTAGWNGNLRWSTNFGAFLASAAYDGEGEYVLAHRIFNAGGVAFQPLQIRDMEDHVFTGSLSANAGWNGLWFDLFGGYGLDRYASNGPIYGASLRYTPEPGLDLALGVRHSGISFIEGETGSNTSAGLSITMGFGDPQRGYFNF